MDVHHPELTVYVEVRDYAAYVHTQPSPAPRLPVGINGRAVSLLSGGIDSPVASWMIAKRGVALDMVHFFSYPYTSLEAKEKVLELARLLTPWTGRLTVHVVPFTAIQEELRRSCPEELFTVIMRRFMMRIAQEVARRCGAKALVTGECLGQVASQTMDAMLVTGSVVELPILRPCIGMDKEEIVQIARRIGTFETSILPYEDCCTVFTPATPPAPHARRGGGRRAGPGHRGHGPGGCGRHRAGPGQPVRPALSHPDAPAGGPSPRQAVRSVVLFPHAAGLSAASL